MYPSQIQLEPLQVTREVDAIQVQGRRVSLAGGSQIRNETLGSTPGGTLSVTATELVQLIAVDGASAGGLIAEVGRGASGRGGNITVVGD